VDGGGLRRPEIRGAEAPHADRCRDRIDVDHGAP
jgi:hypothetical protein